MKSFITTLVFTFIAFALFSNNLQISNVSLTGQNTVNDFTMVRFDISWSNSWRTSTLESNWDAAWIFVKFRRKADIVWYHASLNNTGHAPPTGSVIEPGFVNTGLPFHPSTNPAVGAFIYRDSDGIGNIAFNSVQLRWNYGVNGLADNDSVEVCVYAIEMVSITQGPFLVGDNLFPGSTSASYFVAGTTTAPFQITSEAALDMGNTSPTELWATGNISPAGTLPAAFPKGFQRFYIMKYELSQYMYKEYLNKLTRTQQPARVSAITPGMYMTTTNTNATPLSRNGIRVMSDPGGLLSRVYGNDLNNNGIEGDLNDGQHIACNWVSCEDLRAFADWSGLRLLSELEFEKVCRGTLNPIPNEYAWGSNSIIINATSITNPGQNNEIAGNAGANVVTNNAAAVQGPMRSGNFAQASTDRIQAGAAYFGVMEMSGNLWELVASLGVTQNRLFTGQIHGDGTLTATGTANATVWPTSCGRRGGAWNSTILQRNSLSDRFNINDGVGGVRASFDGIRLGRTSQ